MYFIIFNPSRFTLKNKIHIFFLAGHLLPGLLLPQVRHCRLPWQPVLQLVRRRVQHQDEVQHRQYRGDDRPHQGRGAGRMRQV